MHGDRGRDTGCLLADTTGDPVSLTGNPQVFRAVEEDLIFFDGQVHSTASGFEYAAIAQASVAGTHVFIYFEIEVFEAGFTVGTQRVELDGTQVDEDSIVGTFQS